MNSRCREQYRNPNYPNETFYCIKTRGHDMGHLTYIAGLKYGWSDDSDWFKDTAEFHKAHREYAPWFNAEYTTGVLGQWTDPRYTAKVVGQFHGDFCLQFTAHELAELYVILSGNHDIPEVYLNKVAAALKEAL